MPMHSRMFRKIVGHIDLDPVAFNGFNGRTWTLAVITPKVSGHAFCHFAFNRFSDQMKLFDPVAFILGGSVHPFKVTTGLYSIPVVGRGGTCV